MLDESLRREIARLKEARTADSESGSPSDSQPPEVESHFTRLSNLLNKLKSITDRDPDINSRYSSLSHDFEMLVIAALREAECADLIEKSMEADLESLCAEMKQKEEALQAQGINLANLEQSANAKLAEMENRVQNQMAELKDLESQGQQLTTERDDLVNRLHRAELTAKPAQAEARSFKEHLKAEFSELRAHLGTREEVLDSKGSDPRRAETEQKTEFQNLQLRLQELEAKLASQEKVLNEKDRGIHAASVREAGMGKLIERLSSECEKLSAQLCEKTLMAARFETKSRHSFLLKGKVWEKLLRLARLGRVSASNNKRS